MIASRFLFLVPALVLVTSCANTSTNAHTTPSGTAAASENKGKDDADDKAEKLKKKEREVGYAERELVISQMGNEADERDAKNSVEDAEFKLAVAKNDRENFKTFEKPHKLADAQLDYDRVEERMREAQQELDELVAMYKQEDLAKLTKELVISRSKKNLEFAKRNLELEEKRMANLKDFDLAKKEKDLDQAVMKAERAVMEANKKKEKGAAEIALKTTKAADHIEELKAELAKMQKKGEAKKEAEKVAGL